MKKTPRTKKTAPKSRQSYDQKLATLSPAEQMHQLFHGRPNEGDYYEQHLRSLATWRGLDEAEAQNELRVLTAHCGAALSRWQPEALEHIAALMRKISTEEQHEFNPFKPACGMEYKAFVRAAILAASKRGTVNQWRLACELENTNPNPARHNESDFRRTDSTRKTISDICKRLKIPSKVGCPKVED